MKADRRANLMPDDAEISVRPITPDDVEETTMHLMVGLPCSGKTTYANKLKDKCHALLFTPDIWHLKTVRR